LLGLRIEDPDPHGHNHTNTTKIPTRTRSLPPALLKGYPFLFFSFRGISTKIIGKISQFLSPPEIENPVKNLSLSLAISVFALATLVSAQTQNAVSAPTSAPTTASTVSRTTKAVHYRLQGGTTKVDFRGTDLLQRASGEAKVEGKKTNFEIDAKFQGLEEATKFGLEFLTYVAWAVSPQGRPVNLGELTLDHSGNAHVKAYTDLQTFGMIVTAEPYFAVTQPGNMVVMESASVSGGGENIDAKYELVTRGTYSSTNTHIQDAIFGSTTRLRWNCLRLATRCASRVSPRATSTRVPFCQGQPAVDACGGALPAEAKEGSSGSCRQGATETAEEARLMAVKQKAEDEAQAAAAAREAKARADAEAEPSDVRKRKRHVPRRKRLGASGTSSSAGGTSSCPGGTGQGGSRTHEAGSGGRCAGSRPAERSGGKGEIRSRGAAASFVGGNGQGSRGCRAIGQFAAAG